MFSPCAQAITLRDSIVALLSILNPLPSTTSLDALFRTVASGLRAPLARVGLTGGTDAALLQLREQLYTLGVMASDSNVVVALLGLFASAPLSIAPELQRATYQAVARRGAFSDITTLKSIYAAALPGSAQVR